MDRHIDLDLSIARAERNGPVTFTYPFRATLHRPADKAAPSTIVFTRRDIPPNVRQNMYASPVDLRRTLPQGYGHYRQGSWDVNGVQWTLSPADAQRTLVWLDAMEEQGLAEVSGLGASDAAIEREMARRAREGNDPRVEVTDLPHVRISTIWEWSNERFETVVFPREHGHVQHVSIDTAFANTREEALHNHKAMRVKWGSRAVPKLDGLRGLGAEQKLYPYIIEQRFSDRPPMEVMLPLDPTAKNPDVDPFTLLRAEVLHHLRMRKPVVRRTEMSENPWRLQVSAFVDDAPRAKTFTILPKFGITESLRTAWPDQAEVQTWDSIATLPGAMAKEGMFFLRNTSGDPMNIIPGRVEEVEANATTPEKRAAWQQLQVKLDQWQEQGLAGIKDITPGKRVKASWSNAQGVAGLKGVADSQEFDFENPDPRFPGERRIFKAQPRNRVIEWVRVIVSPDDGSKRTGFVRGWSPPDVLKYHLNASNRVIMFNGSTALFEAISEVEKTRMLVWLDAMEEQGLAGLSGLGASDAAVEREMALSKLDGLKGLGAPRRTTVYRATRPQLTSADTPNSQGQYAYEVWAHPKSSWVFLGMLWMPVPYYFWTYDEAGGRIRLTKAGDATPLNTTYAQDRELESANWKVIDEVLSNFLATHYRAPREGLRWKVNSRDSGSPAWSMYVKELPIDVTKFRREGRHMHVVVRPPMHLLGEATYKVTQWGKESPWVERFYSFPGSGERVMSASSPGEGSAADYADNFEVDGLVVRTRPREGAARNAPPRVEYNWGGGMTELPHDALKVALDDALERGLAGIKDIAPGKRVAPARAPWIPGVGVKVMEWPHLAPPGYRLFTEHVKTDNTRIGIRSVLYKPGAGPDPTNMLRDDEIGNVSGMVLSERFNRLTGKPNEGGKVLVVSNSYLRPNFQRQGLGPVMYEALLAAAYRLGARVVNGSVHSTPASGAWEKLAAKHGLAYRAHTMRDEPPDKTQDLSFDERYSSYSFPLKGLAAKFGPAEWAPHEGGPSATGDSYALHLNMKPALAGWVPFRAVLVKYAFPEGSYVSAGAPTSDARERYALRQDWFLRYAMDPKATENYYLRFFELDDLKGTPRSEMAWRTMGLATIRRELAQGNEITLTGPAPRHDKRVWMLREEDRQGLLVWLDTLEDRGLNGVGAVRYPQQQEKAVMLNGAPLRGLGDGEPACKPGSVPFQRLELKRQKCARVQATSPGALVAVLRKELKDVAQEHTGVLLLNTRNDVISVVQVSQGGLDTATVDPRVVFGAALVAGARALVLYHNHPSGDPTPSAQDIALTRQLKQMGQTLGVQVLDHLIITYDGYKSFLTEGIL